MTTPTTENDSPGKIALISLGCSKALVDSELILTQLRAEGYALNATVEEADLVLINTCGFIEEAIQESLDSIDDALTENGKVIVTGCLGKDQNLLTEKFPELMAITGPHDITAVMNAIHHVLPPAHDPHYDLVPPQGIKLTPSHYAYLKISEGCNHHCSFCIIPSIRGKLISRPITDILTEAEKLVAAGVKELLIISQDTSAYGLDLRYKPEIWKSKAIKTNLYDLVKHLGELGVWVRLHYVYPYPHVDKIIPLMAEGKVLPYLDIPFQHANPRILKLMKRPANSDNILERLKKWREICPSLKIRSTFIVGFPGETDQEFEDILSFLEQAQLDRVGCFTYSDVEGAAANNLPNSVPIDVRIERQLILMETQANISALKLDNMIDSELTVLIDEVHDNQAIGRSYGESPEVDGVIVINNASNTSVGDLVQVIVESNNDHDLFANIKTKPISH